MIATPGVYKIVCKPTGQVYIGASINVYLRIRTHKCVLIRQKHENVLLQGLFNEYGIDSFEFTILEKGNFDKDTLLVIEQKYIDLYRDSILNIYRSYTHSDKLPNKYRHARKRKESRQAISNQYKQLKASLKHGDMAAVARVYGVSRATVLYVARGVFENAAILNSLHQRARKNASLSLPVEP